MNSDLVESVWILKPVAELVDVYIGGTPSRHVDEYWDLDVKWASAADVAACNTRYIHETSERISIMGLEKSSAKLLEEDTVLITARGTVGALCMLPEPMAFNQTCYGLVSKGEIDPTFLYFALKARIAHVKAQTYGAVFDTITTSSFDNILIPVPPIEIQQRIASILSNYDDLIENNHHRIQILEEMARAIYREWFVHFRFPGHEKVEMINSELGEIPKGWKPGQLGDIAEEVRRNINPSDVPTDTPYVGLAEIPRRSIALSEWGRAEEAGSSKLQFRKGEILFGKIRAYFHKVVVAPLDGICSGDTIVIVPKGTDMFALSLSVVNSENFVAHATASSKGTKMPRADWDVLVKYPVIIPESLLLRKFNSLIENLVNLIQTLVFMNRSLQHARNVLLPRLVSGEIDVSELNIDIPVSNTHKTSKYDKQSTLNRWLDGDEENDGRK